jgi:NADPH:quinone reductase-like Zn-dependent oxidoreductase
MKAAYIDSYGGADALKYGERPEPKVQPDSMLVQVAAASINPVDWKILHGYNDPRFPTIFPLITGWDVAGVVVQTGPAVEGFKAGDRIVAYARKDFIGEGTWAELVNVPERCAAHAPKSVDLAESAALPLAGLTAFQGLTQKLEISAGQTVVINGAAGGVGSFAVQIARALGAEVIGTGSERSFDRISELGAAPIPYGERFADAVREIAPDGVHAVFDLYGEDELFAAKELLNAQGRVASLGLPDKVAEAGAIYTFVKPNASQLTELVALVDAGKIRIDVQQTFALSDAAAAVELAEQKRTHGKLVLLP